MNFIDDCNECCYDLCETEYCKGPKDLPNALIRAISFKESISPLAPSEVNCLDGCSLEQKAFYCCRQNPITKENIGKIFPDKEFTIKAMSVCPSFGIDGKCEDYKTRPGICRDYNCK